jgi:hypothetical protein
VLTAAALAAHNRAGRWVRRRLDAFHAYRGPLPEYGSPEWAALRADDTAREASALEAAERWRTGRAYQQWLDDLLADDPDTWFETVTRDANDQARRAAAQLARQPTHQELTAIRAQHQPPRDVQATPGWAPVAVPGRPGWWRHWINGEQHDFPHREAPAPSAQGAE